MEGAAVLRMCCAPMGRQGMRKCGAPRRALVPPPTEGSVRGGIGGPGHAPDSVLHGEFPTHCNVICRQDGKFRLERLTATSQLSVTVGVSQTRL